MMELPKPPPRKGRRPEISPPFNYVHVTHVGLDFDPNDVKKAIRPMTENLKAERQKQEGSSEYEIVNRSPRDSRETPIMTREESLKAPSMDAPVYNPAPTAEPNTSKTPTEGTLHYENAPTRHVYENLIRPQSSSRPSRKKYAPPPPPKEVKPKLVSEDSTEPVGKVTMRKPSDRQEDVNTMFPFAIDTASRVEPTNPSVIIDRPALLGEMRIGLDDPIPLQTGPSSKYRTPTMLTPSPRQSEASSEVQTKPESSSPTRVLENQHPVEPETTTTKKRRAPQAPKEVQNVIAELKTQLSSSSKAEDSQKPENLFRADEVPEIPLEQVQKEQLLNVENKSTNKPVIEKCEPQNSKSATVLVKQPADAVALPTLEKSSTSEANSQVITSTTDNSEQPKLEMKSNVMSESSPEVRRKNILKKQQSIEAEIEAVATQLCDDLNTIDKTTEKSNRNVEKDPASSGDLNVEPTKQSEMAPIKVPVPKPRKTKLEPKLTTKDENTLQVDSWDDVKHSEEVKKRLTAVTELTEDVSDRGSISSEEEHQASLLGKENSGKNTNWETESTSEEDEVIRF